jgi:hypothetical protein
MRVLSNHSCIDAVIVDISECSLMSLCAILQCIAESSPDCRRLVAGRKVKQGQASADSQAGCILVGDV